MRHPIYAGYTIIHVGFLLAFPSLWNLVLYSTELAIQMARVLREELLLVRIRAIETMRPVCVIASSR